MELPDRYEIEDHFADRLAKLTKAQRAELETLLGDPPDLENVPESFWEKCEQETNDNLLILLLLIASSSAEFHGAPPADADVVAALTGWATGRAKESAEDITKTTQTRLVDFFAKIGEESQRREERQPDAAPPSFTEAYGDDFADQLDSLYGPQRVDGIAATETTNAQTAGGEIGIAVTVGLSPDDLWVTEDDSRVCPTCGPLHMQPRSYWERFFPAGPGSPHPVCRCHVQYANAGKEELAGV